MLPNYKGPYDSIKVAYDYLYGDWLRARRSATRRALSQALRLVKLVARLQTLSIKILKWSFP